MWQGRDIRNPKNERTFALGQQEMNIHTQERKKSNTRKQSKKKFS